MSANLYCWERSLKLWPGTPDFERDLEALLTPPFPVGTHTMREFVQALLTIYPDLTDTEDTVWSDGPIGRNMSGQFIDLGIQWSRYQEAAPVIIATARRFKLHTYDPQNERLYPVATRGNEVARIALMLVGALIGWRLDPGFPGFGGLGMPLGLGAGLVVYAVWLSKRMKGLTILRH